MGIRDRFTERKCAECHADAIGRAGSGPRIQQWESVRDPVALVAALWNHIPNMKTDFAAKKISWPVLTTQDLADIMVFLRSLPALRRAPVACSVCPRCSGGGRSYG